MVLEIKLIIVFLVIQAIMLCFKFANLEDDLQNQICDLNGELKQTHHYLVKNAKYSPGTKVRFQYHHTALFRAFVGEGTIGKPEVCQNGKIMYPLLAKPAGCAKNYLSEDEIIAYYREEPIEVKGEENGRTTKNASSRTGKKKKKTSKRSNRKVKRKRT